MDARLRERRRVLRVNTSQHIDCNVRRRSHRADAFFVPWVRIRSLASRPTCIPRGGGLPPPAALPAGAAVFVCCVLSPHGSVRPSRPVPAATLNEWRTIVHPTAGFAPEAFQKPPLVRKCSKSRHSFEASPLSSGGYRRKARPPKPQRFKSRHSSPDVS